MVETILYIIIIVGIIGIIYYFNRSSEPSLYERLGGVYSIAAVVDYFSDRLIKNPVVGVDSANPLLREWNRNRRDRLPGLKFMRTLWLCDVAGGPFKFHSSRAQSWWSNPLNLTKAHCPLKVSSGEFDAVAEELSKSLDHFKVPAREKQEVLAAFLAHKKEVIFCAS